MRATFSRLDEILAYWAAATPDAEAVRWPGGTFTFAELEARVADLAAVLAERGAGPGHRVGIYMDRSQFSIIAAYAILRTGAAYVPLDIASPVQRVATIIRSCGIDLAVADPNRAADLETLPLSAVVDATGASLKDGGRPAAGTGGPVAPDEPAYILYTSGTTGVPKGMVHTHASGLAFVDMSVKLCGVVSSDRVAHHTPLHFDMSIFDIFSAHSVGACTIVLPTMYTKMPASLAKLIEAERITVWYSVPFALIQLAERGALDQRDLSSLRVVMFGGESILPGQLKRFADFAPQARFINGYGPAEINICTAKVLGYDALDGVTPINLGVACDGVDTLVTDDGELLVAGAQLMQGYWNNPERNAATLKEIDPGDGVTRRYYATGDVVRVREDGEFDLIGRIGRQIKLRGYRVELDEVELALSSCAGVSEAVVVHKKAAEVLVAYVCARAGADVEPGDVRAGCAKTLPPYAVPSEIIVVDDMPRTSTGKVDRLKLSEAQNV